ncbi:hypothetical protein M569_17509 [Genlisea aurea]|uniref:Cyclin-dependent kinase inhibitor domain-containing protein n=1 Tax=Genlisea aurea TaxID=192259 RepID=S8BRR5_9LAMI|nr:hypothetical protein M569_17509 [Genlisea aurea]
MPTADELEEFFAAAEKELQLQFIHKYNYDIVKDKPVEGGRFEWIKKVVPPSLFLFLAMIIVEEHHEAAAEIDKLPMDLLAHIFSFINSFKDLAQ